MKLDLNITQRGLSWCRSY